MAQFGLQDFMGYGPPNDTGVFQLQSQAVGFTFTFSGVTYYATIRSGVRGWTPLSVSTAPEVAINAAFTQLGVGARVTLLCGTYTLTATGTIELGDRQVLEGQGSGTHIVAPDPSIEGITISNKIYCVLRRFKITVPNEEGITIHATPYFLIEELDMNCKDGCIELTDFCAYGIISKCNFWSSDANCIIMVIDENAPTAIIISNNFFMKTGLAGANAGIFCGEGCANLMISSNYFHNQCSWGIYGCFGMSIIQGNQFYGCITGGIRAGFHALDAIILGNAFDSMTDGIYLDAGRYENIQHNKFVSCVDGIHIDADSENAVILNNRFRSCTTNLNDLGTNTITHELFIKTSDPDGNIGTHPAIILTDGVTTMVRDQIQIPSELQQIIRAKAIVVAGGTGNMRRAVSTNWGKTGSENYNASSDSIAAGEVAVTQNLLNAIDIDTAFTGIDMQDLVGIEFTREGGHANDTVNADCYFLGFRIEYV